MPKANIHKHTERDSTKVVIDPLDKKVMVLKNGKVRMIAVRDLEDQKS